MSTNSPGPLPAPLASLLSGSVPEPLKAVAGLAIVALDEARALPQKLVGLPVAVAGQAMQTSMRIQQQYAELIGKGDELLNSLRGESNDVPSWATFDEDEAISNAPSGGVGPGSAFDRHVDEEPLPPARRRTTRAKTQPQSPVEGYDEFTLPQLRARVKKFSATELEDLIRYESSGQNRAPYVTMLANRLAAVRHA